ncbi:hypothetical protein [Helicobacter sp. 23-1046]
MIRVYIGGLLLGIILAFVACSEEDYPIGASPAWNYIPDNISSLTPKEQEELRKRLTTANNDKNTNETNKDNKQDDESNNQKTPKPQNTKKAPSKSPAPQKRQKDPFLPQQKVTTKPLPSWIYSTAIIEVHFHDGSMRKGFATMVKNGLYLTSSEIVYSDSLIPSAIFAKIQDTSANIIICAFKLDLRAIDMDSGLALLENIASTDDYCNVREKSYYHDRIQKKYAVDIFSPTSKLTQNQKVFYSFIDEGYSFVPKSLKLGRAESYFDEKRHREIPYGFNIAREEYENLLFGKGIFDSNGRFLGIVSLSPKSFLPVFVKKEVLQDFVCDLNERSIVNNAEITRGCKNLKYRERYFLSKSSL